VTISLWQHADGFDVGSLDDANPLLAARHYLGPTQRAELVVVQYAERVVVAAQVYALPTSRRLPSDGSWLELSRWVLTPEAGRNAGSRMHGYALRQIRRLLPDVTTLISYSDPSVGHTGALYRACNWRWRPTWHRLRPPPTQGASWDGVHVQSVKDRWAYFVTRDARRDELLAIDDEGALRRATPEQLLALTS
jgi:hypothetical protein